MEGYDPKVCLSGKVGAGKQQVKWASRRLPHGIYNRVLQCGVKALTFQRPVELSISDTEIDDRRENHGKNSDFCAQ